MLERLIPRRAPAHWLADAELVELHDCDVSRDPVRPELDAQFRRAHGRKILGLRLNERTLGVVCVLLNLDSSVPEAQRLVREAPRTRRRAAGSFCL